MKGYALPRVFVLSITGEGCQESGEIKVNNSDKCVCICTLPLIAARRSSPRFTLCNNNTNISANNRIVIILTEQPVATAEASLLNVTQVYHRKKKKKEKKRIRYLRRWSANRGQLCFQIILCILPFGWINMPPGESWQIRTGGGKRHLR